MPLDIGKRCIKVRYLLPAIAQPKVHAGMQSQQTLPTSTHQVLNYPATTLNHAISHSAARQQPPNNEPGVRQQAPTSQPAARHQPARCRLDKNPTSQQYQHLAVYVRPGETCITLPEIGKPMNDAHSRPCCHPSTSSQLTDPRQPTTSPNSANHRATNSPPAGPPATSQQQANRCQQEPCGQPAAHQQPAASQHICLHGRYPARVP
jgi:hypothetical protein